MNDNELEEYRYDVAGRLLKQMSNGTRYMFALDRMIHLLDEKSEAQLKEMDPKPQKKKKKKRSDKAAGF